MSDDDDDGDNNRNCEQCGRPFDRPSFYEECESRHPAPTLVQRLVEEVERELRSRKGLGYGCLDDDIVNEIRDALADRISRKLTAADRGSHE